MANEVKQIIPMPELDIDGKIAKLELNTDKMNDQVVSSASVHFVENGCITFEVFGDYRKVLGRTRVKPVTQKVLNTQHANTFTAAQIEVTKADAVEFYKEKRREGRGRRA